MYHFMNALSQSIFISFYFLGFVNLNDSKISHFDYFQSLVPRSDTLKK